MLPKHHFIFGFIFVIILCFIFPNISIFSFTIIFLSSVLIDVDHVLYYFFKTGDINPVRAYKWYMEKRKKFHKLPIQQRKNVYSGFYLFHGIEWLIILFLLGIYVSQFFIFILIGFSFHFVIDVIHEIYDKRTIDKSSLIWNYWRFRKLKMLDNK